MCEQTIVPSYIKLFDIILIITSLGWTKKYSPHVGIVIPFVGKLSATFHTRDLELHAKEELEMFSKHLYTHN